MSSYENNIYYSPEKTGLEIVDMLNEEDLSYEFNDFLVVKHIKLGRVFYGQSSGCSYPCPFEEYDFDGPDKTNLEEVTKSSFKSFEAEVNSFCSEEYKTKIPQHKKDELIDTVKKLLKKKK